MARIGKRLQARNAEDLVLAELAEFLVVMDYASAATYCLDALAKARTNDYDDDLKRVFFALWFLENVATHGRDDRKTIRPVVEMSEALLQRCQIQPVSSKLSDLYTRVYRAFGQWHQAGGDSWQAMWQNTLGQKLGRGSVDSSESETVESQQVAAVEEIMIAADCAYYLGHMDSAATAYYAAEGNAKEAGIRARAGLGRIVSLRLLGDLGTAQNLALAAAYEFSDITDLSADFAWQRCLCEVTTSHSALPFLPQWQRKSPLYQPRMALTSTLMAYGLPELLNTSKIRRARTFREHFNDDIGRSTREYPLLKQLITIEACYDETTSMIARLKDLGDALADQRPRLMAEDYLVFMAAGIRWLVRNRHDQFQSYLLNEYTSLSMRLSKGASRDVMGLLPDLAGETPTVINNQTSQALGDLPVTTSSRMLKLSSLAARAGFAYTRHKTSGESPSMARPEVFLHDIARLVIEELGEIKGPFMKVAQIFAGIEGLSPEARRSIQNSLSTTRMVASQVFYRAFKAERGVFPQSYFRNWQDKPIGIGSMAQVFKAELPDGSPVAVKIMYPELTKIVKSDIRVIKFLRPIVRQLIPEIDIDRLAEMLIGNLLNECDMRIEGARHQQIYELFSGRPGIIVPRPYLEHSSATVLVMDYVEGERIADFARTADGICAKGFHETIYSTYYEMMEKLHLAQLDPHAGNFLVSGANVVLLDFGGLIPVSARAAALFARGWKASVHQNYAEMHGAMIDCGIIDAKVSIEHFTRELAPIFVQLFHKDFDPKKHNIFKIVNHFFKGGLRQSINLDGEVALIFLTSFLLHMVVYSLEHPEQTGQPTIHSAS